jgi:signal transduction histidine kinase
MRRLRPLLVALVPIVLASLPAAAQVSPPSDTGPLLGGTKAIAIGLAIVAVLLSVLLYVVPLRAVAVAKRRTETAMSERILTLQEEDRRRIARELHDGAGQALTAARLQLLALRANDAAPQEVVEQIMNHVDEAIDEVRRSTTALAPPTLAELGLMGALLRHCDNLASASGLEVRLDSPPRLPLLPAYVETTIYRIVQEALTNAVRHANATRAWVKLGVDGERIELEVGDDGAGSIEASRRGFGFESIGERARLAGGKLELLGEPGPGARLRITIPIVTGTA